MDLITRAQQYIAAPPYPSPIPLLTDCVAALDSDGMHAVRLLAADKYDGRAINLTIKAPAAYCLLAWGDLGLRTLVATAQPNLSSNNVSLVIRLLAHIAGGQDPTAIPSFLPDALLSEAVIGAAGDWKVLESAAQKHLTELILSIDDDSSAAISAGVSLLTIAVANPNAIGHLSRAWASRWIAVGPTVLDAYEDLMVRTIDDERAYQSFFENHPLLLDPRAFEVWAQPDFHGKLEPDFVIRRHDNSYVVVEIETPAKPLVTLRNQLSHHATHAVSQTLQYQEFLQTRLTEASKEFPEITQPTGLVVVGVESSLNHEQKAALRLENLSRSNIKIVGFDRLLATARAVTKNVIEGISGAFVKRRLP